MHPAHTPRHAAADHAERIEPAAAALPDGRFLTLDLAWRGGRIAGARLGLAAKPKALGRSTEAGKAVALGMRNLIAGKDADFSELPLCWDGVPPFTAAILRTLFEKVPAGRKLTYGELAALAGHPGKARAVGQAMARNPWPLIVPCHRVLGANGALTGYTNPHGLDLKALLLALESSPGAKA